MESSLSIFIPTYNRASKLKKLLESLHVICLHFPNNVAVNIINNASTDNTKEVITGIETEVCYKINYFENLINIGGNANVVRCLEYCKTEWLWVIGDDDSPVHNCLEIIFNSIKLYPNAVFVNHQTTIGLNYGAIPEKIDVVSQGQSGLIDNLKSFPNLLFISSSIYKASEIRNNIKTGYYFSNSCAPHVAMLLDYLGDNPLKESVYSTSYICDWEPPLKEDKWNDAVVNASLCEILFIVRKKEDRIKFFEKIDFYHPYAGFSKNDALSALIIQTSSRQEIAISYLSSISFKAWLYDKEIDKEIFKNIYTQLIILFSKFRLFRILLKRMAKITFIDKFSIYNRFAPYKNDRRL